MVEQHQRSVAGQRRALRWCDRRLQGFGFRRKAECASQFLRWNPAIGTAAGQERQGASGTNNRLKQPPSGEAVAEFEAVGHQPLDAEEIRQGPHYVVQSLADQDDLAVGSHPFLELPHALRFELRLQDIVKILLAQQVETVATYSTQQGVQHPRGENPVGGIQQRPDQNQQGHAPAARPTFEEALRVPREVSDRAHRAEVEQAPLDAPERCGSERACLGWLGQTRSGWLVCGLALELKSRCAHLVRSSLLKNVYGCVQTN